MASTYPDLYISAGGWAQIAAADVDLTWQCKGGAVEISPEADPADVSGLRLMVGEIAAVPSGTAIWVRSAGSASVISRTALLVD